MASRPCQELPVSTVARKNLGRDQKTWVAGLTVPTSSAQRELNTESSGYTVSICANHSSKRVLAGDFCSGLSVIF